MKTLAVDALKATAAHRPAGYLEACLQAGTEIAPGILQMADEKYAAIQARYNPNTQPISAPSGYRDFQPPTLTELATNFASAIARWAHAGFPTVTQDQFHIRLESCQACEHWNRTSILPRCRLCGCTALKLWLTTERCPAARWQ